MLHRAINDLRELGGLLLGQPRKPSQFQSPSRLLLALIDLTHIFTDLVRVKLLR